MSRGNIEKLYSTFDAMQVLGYISKNIDILGDKKLNLSVDDFASGFHKVIYSALYNMYNLELKTITSIHLEEYLRSFNNSWYEVYTKYDKDNNYIESIIEICNEENFKYHLLRLKKFSLLRDLTNAGWDISKIYDITETKVDTNLKFESMDIKDILNEFELTSNTLKTKWNSGANLKEQNSGQGLRELLESYKSGGAYGIKLPNPVFNAAYKGARAGKLLLIGGASGAGKTKTSIMNICNVSMPFIYDNKLNCWIDNGKYHPSLFITTELLLEEVQIQMLSCVSGIEQNKIEEYDLTEEELKRLNKAIWILEQFPIHIHHLPDYDLTDLELVIQNYVLKYNIEFIALDYIHLTPKLIIQLRGVREDILILQIMTMLKNLANDYGLCILVGSQLNRSANQQENQDSFAGFRSAFSIGDKTDGASIILKATIKDIEKLKDIGLIKGMGEVNPNIVHTIVKNRGGKLSFVKVWCKFNHGNFREEVIAVTDIEMNPISIEYIEQEEESIENANAILQRLNS